MAIFKYEPITGHIDVAYREHYHPIEMLSHHHNAYEVIFIVEGTVNFSIGSKDYTAGKNSLLFINNVEDHEYKVLEYPYKRYVIMMKSDFIHSAVNDTLLTSIFCHRPEHYNHVIQLDLEHVSPVQTFLSFMLNEYKSQKPLWETSLKLILYQLMILLYRISRDNFPQSKYDGTEDHKYNTIIEIQQYIESNYTEEITLAELSDLFHIDMYYLCNLFKKVTGYTFKSYLTLQRISKAKELLCSTNDNVTEIGLSVGFNNLSHFIRTFKKHVGSTPYQYRKNYTK